MRKSVKTFGGFFFHAVRSCFEMLCVQRSESFRVEFIPSQLMTGLDGAVRYLTSSVIRERPKKKKRQQCCCRF